LRPTELVPGIPGGSPPSCSLKVIEIEVKNRNEGRGGLRKRKGRWSLPLPLGGGVQPRWRKGGSKANSVTTPAHQVPMSGGDQRGGFQPTPKAAGWHPPGRWAGGSALGKTLGRRGLLGRLAPSPLSCRRPSAPMNGADGGCCWGPPRPNGMAPGRVALSPSPVVLDAPLMLSMLFLRFRTADRRLMLRGRGEKPPD